MDNSHLYEYVQCFPASALFCRFSCRGGKRKLKIDESVFWSISYWVFFSGADGSSGRSENVAGWENVLCLRLRLHPLVPSISLGFVLADAESTDWISGGRNFQLASDTERNWWGGLRHFLISVFGRWPLSGTLKDGHREREREMKKQHFGSSSLLWLINRPWTTRRSEDVVDDFMIGLAAKRSICRWKYFVCLVYDCFV